MPKAIDGRKVCSKCRERKLVTEFSKDNSRVDGLSYQCKTCVRTYQQSTEGKAANKRYYKANREEILAQHKEYDATEVGKAVQRMANKRYYQTDTGKVVRQRYRQSEKGTVTRQHYQQSDAGKVVQRAASRRYRRSDGGKVANRAATRRRRARRVGCAGSHAQEEFLALCKEYGFRCLRCDEVFPLEELTEDHIIPIGPGVSDYIDNIQPLCGPCNSWKGQRTIDYRRTTKA